MPYYKTQPATVEMQWIVLVFALEVHPQVSVFTVKCSGSSAQKMAAFCYVRAPYGSPVVLRGAGHQHLYTGRAFGQQILVFNFTRQAVLVVGCSGKVAVNDALYFSVNFSRNDSGHTACHIV
jgi:hypothetical protein